MIRSHPSFLRKSFQVLSHNKALAQAQALERCGLELEEMAIKPSLRSSREP
jgi:hypothetical protein